MYATGHHRTSPFLADRKGVSSCSVIVEEREGERKREKAEKKIYTYSSISKSLVFSVLAWMQSDGCTTCARTFFTLSFGGLPRNFFLDSISRLPRDRIVEMARALFRASRVTRTRVPAAAQLLSDSDMWQMKGAEQRRMKNELIFMCESRIVFMRNPSTRMPVRVERVLIWIALYEIPAIFLVIEQKVNMTKFMMIYVHT